MVPRLRELFGQVEVEGAGAQFNKLGDHFLVRTSFLQKIINLTCCLEGPGGNDEALEEDALLKVEALLQRGRHVGRSDGEGDGDETLFQDVVHFEVADDTSLPAIDACLLVHDQINFITKR